MPKKMEELIAYCGLYCGDCFGYRQKAADLARDLRKELRQCHFDKLAEAMSEIPMFKQLEYYPQAYEMLGILVKLRCHKGCRSGGGPPFCNIRKCCINKEITGCWECSDFTTCQKLNFLKAGHGDAHIKNLRKLKKSGLKEFVKGKKYWYTKPTTK